jgi:hypothetical protein
MDLGAGIPLAGDLSVDNVGCNSSTPVGAESSTSAFSNSFTVANQNASYGGNTIRNNDFFLVEIRTSAAFTAKINGISVTF